MKLLAFDTCLDKTYIVLKSDNEVLASEVLSSDENNYHSAFLISTIKSVLKKNGLTPKEIDGIAINIGPGSFTGIRACTTVARVMAQQLNIKAVGVSSLEIIHKAMNEEYIVVLDARKNKGYVYDNELLGAIELEEIDKLAKDRKIVTDDRLFDRFKDIGSEVVSYQQLNLPLGEVLASLGQTRLETEECNWQDVKPLYIQPPPIGGK